MLRYLLQYSIIKVWSSLNTHCTQLTTLAATLYKSLGINSQTILALAAVYGTIAFTSNCITTKYLTDQWGRRKYGSSYMFMRELTDSF